MDPQPEEPQLVDLREFVGILRRRKWIVILTTLVIASLAVGLVYRRTPVYSTTARVEVRPLTADSAYSSFYDLQSGMDTEAQKVTSQQVTDAAVNLGASTNADVSTSVPANTTYIDITCTDPDPSVAASCANAYAQAYVDDRRTFAQSQYDDAAKGPQAAIDSANRQINSLKEQIQEDTDAAIRQADIEALSTTRSTLQTATIQLLSVPRYSTTPAILALSAETPSVPSNKNYVTTAILAVLLGFAVGVGIAFARERLDERIGGRRELESDLGAPVIALVPKAPGQRGKNETRLITLSAPNSGASEAYRTARTTLLYLAREGGLQVISVTGPGQGEGKTTTVANLAVTLAQSGKRVVAVSCDLRRPRLHRYFDTGNDDGLSDVLTGKADIRTALRKTKVPGLLVMPSGHVPTNPAELLASPVMDDLLEELRKVADFVLLDTAPSLVVSDALGLAPKADGVLVVADAATTHRTALTHLRTQLDRGGGQVIGSILNNLDRQSSKYYDRYGGYYVAGERYKAMDEAAVLGSDTNGHSAANGHPSNGRTEDENGQHPKGRRRGRRSASASRTAPQPPPTESPDDSPWS